MTWDEIFAALERHTGPEGFWSIEWNDHRGVYQTVEDQWDDDDWSFESPEDAARCRRENILVGLRWYKNTPIGSYTVAAPDMDGLRRRVAALIANVVEGQR